jgi:hypothetical protein
MTTFTTIPNSSLEPGKPIRSIDGLALRDNPLAIAEGDATAPKIQTAALIAAEQMNTTNVLSATASASAGAVGTYAAIFSPISYTAGSTYSAASIGLVSGTWRCMTKVNPPYPISTHVGASNSYIIKKSTLVRCQTYDH